MKKINKLYLTTKYNANIDDIIRKLKNILDESEDFSENYFKNIYPDDKGYYIVDNINPKDIIIYDKERKL